MNKTDKIPVVMELRLWWEVLYEVGSLVPGRYQLDVICQVTSLYREFSLLKMEQKLHTPPMIVLKIQCDQRDGHLLW